MSNEKFEEFDTPSHYGRENERRIVNRDRRTVTKSQIKFRKNAKAALFGGFRLENFGAF